MECCGALYLAGQAALHSGAGKVVLGFLAKNISPNSAIPELIVANVVHVLQNIRQFDVLVVGPGMSKAKEAVEILDIILDLDTTIPKVFDADALNIIATSSPLQEKFKKVTNKIITPHPKEASRLLDESLLNIQQNRFDAVVRLCVKFNTLALLKGAGSLLCDGNTIFINQTGSVALSNAGQGDVLCGIIGALLAQKMANFDALRLGVYVHGATGDYLEQKYGGPYGVIASKVALHCSVILNQLLVKK